MLVSNTLKIFCCTQTRAHIHASSIYNKPAFGYHFLLHLVVSKWYHTLKPICEQTIMCLYDTKLCKCVNQHKRKKNKQFITGREHNNFHVSMSTYLYALLIKMCCVFLSFFILFSLLLFFSFVVQYQLTLSYDTTLRMCFNPNIKLISELRMIQYRHFICKHKFILWDRRFIQSFIVSKENKYWEWKMSRNTDQQRTVWTIWIWFCP